MDTSKSLDFRIDVFSPDTIPMCRLAEYMLELAALYGSPASVHFKEMRQGSAVLNAVIESDAMASVESRLRSVNDTSAPDDLRRAYQNINGMLKSDKAVGEVMLATGAVILAFPGRDTLVHKTYRVKEAGILDGIVIRTLSEFYVRPPQMSYPHSKGAPHLSSCLSMRERHWNVRLILRMHCASVTKKVFSPMRLGRRLNLTIKLSLSPR